MQNIELNSMFGQGIEQNVENSQHRMHLYRIRFRCICQQLYEDIHYIEIENKNKLGLFGSKE